MLKKTILPITGLALLIILAPSWAIAENAQITALQNIIQRKIDLINGWDALAQKLFILTVIVAILGIATGALSHVKAKWAKIAIALAGVTVAIITAVTNIRYPVDYKTYKKQTIKAKIIIDEIQMQIPWLSGINSSDELKEMIDKNIMPKLNKINDIDKLLSAKNDSSLFAVSEAYAQERSPQWITERPRGEKTLFYVGYGIDADPGRAERAAVAYARETARIEVVDALVQSGRRKHDPSNSLIAKAVLETAEVVNNFVKYDPVKKVYRHFSLLQIDVETAKDRLQFLAARKKITIPEHFMDFLKKEQANTARSSLTR